MKLPNGLRIIVVAALGLSASGVALGTEDLQLTTGYRKYNNVYSASTDKGDANAVETTLAYHHAFESVPVALGPSATFLQYRSFDRPGFGETNAQDFQLALDVVASTPELTEGLTGYSRFKAIAYSKGERVYNLNTSDSGYDVKGKETIRTSGAHLAFGLLYKLTAELGLMAELDGGSEMIKTSDSTVSQYVTEGDTLTPVEPSRGYVAHNSQAMLLGLNASF